MRTPVGRGALVLVGGHSRGVGKTLLIEKWLRTCGDTRWVAVKVSAHRHAPEGVPVPLIEEARPGALSAQTGRYLMAGADRAFLVRAPELALPRAAAFVERLRDAGNHVIVESNRLARYLRPALLLFVVDPEIGDWKASSADCLCAPHVVLCRHRGGPSHDSDTVWSAVGDRPSFGTRALHRVALSRAAAYRAGGADAAGGAG